MKKILYTLLVVGTLVAVSSMNKTVRADAIPDALVGNGMSYRVVTTSGQIFTGGGTMYRIDFPTMTAASTGNDFVQMFDTVAMPSCSYGALLAAASTWALTPQYQLATTTAANNANIIRDYQPYGIYVSKGLFLISGPGGSGGTYTTGVGFKR